MQINKVNNQQSFKAIRPVNLGTDSKEFAFIEKAAKGFLKEPIKALENQGIDIDVFRSCDSDNVALKSIDIHILKDKDYYVYDNELMYKEINSIKDANKLLSKTIGKAIDLISK